MTRPIVKLQFICVLIVFAVCAAAPQENVAAGTAGISAASTTTAASSAAPSSAESATPAQASSASVDEQRAKYLIADDVTPCQQNDPKLGDCVKRAFDLVLPRLRGGNKELNILPWEPFVLNRTSFQYTNGAVSGRITMRNAQVHGFSRAQLKSVEMKVNKGQIKMRLQSYVPQLDIHGNYKADMSFNNARVKPRGTFNVTLVDLNLNQVAEGEFYEKDGHRFVRLSKFDVDPKISDLKINANGIFPDPTLNELVLNVANQYWKDIYRIMLPETRQYWAPMLLRVINESLASIPFDAFVKEK